MSYPRVLHKGPVTDRQTKIVDNEDDHAKAKKAGWSDTPANWGDHDAEHGTADDAGGDDAGAKRPVPKAKK